MTGATSFAPSDSRCDRPAGSTVIVVVAHYRAAPGNADAVAAALQEYAPQVRSEPGCAGFDAHRRRDDPAEFVLYERYLGQTEFDAHVASAHYEAIARDRIRPLLADRTVAFYEPLGPG